MHSVNLVVLTNLIGLLSRANEHCYTPAVSLAINSIVIGLLVIMWPCINENVSHVGMLPVRDMLAACDQCTGKACDQTMTKAGGRMFL